MYGKTTGAFPWPPGLTRKVWSFSAQDHHTVIRRVTEEDRGKGIWREKDYQSVDGLITDVPGLTLVTHYADCVPLFFLDPVRRAVGLTHAGWRGTVSSIGPITVRRMREEFGTDPKDLKAAVGPSIGKCCYEVDDVVADRVRALAGISSEQVLFPKENGRYQLDLWELNRQLLVGAGIPQTQITVSGVCTCCHSDLLFSHRATGGRRGGLAAFLKILPEEGLSDQRGRRSPCLGSRTGEKKRKLRPFLHGEGKGGWNMEGKYAKQEERGDAGTIAQRKAGDL